jgi:hypothetical protein
MWLLPILGLAVMSWGTSTWAQSNGGPAAPAAENAQVVQPPDGSVNWKGVGAGAGAVVSNLVYVPAKLVYGILGGIAGGAGYALTGGNKQVANSIWRSSLGGDYVLTPQMMTGQKPIYFSGPSDAGPMQPNPANSASAPNSVPTGAAMSTPATGTSAGPATYPIDSGAGPVGSTGSAPPYAKVSPSYQGNNHPAPHRAPLPDTSIE